jgi:hypothetical protein
VSLSNGGQCLCTPNHTGKYCEKSIFNLLIWKRGLLHIFYLILAIVSGATNICVPNPCRNGGRCEILPSGLNFHCHCVSPFTGTLCGRSKSNKRVWVEYDIQSNNVPYYMCKVPRRPI